MRDGVQFERELDNGSWIECRGLPIEEDEGWVAVFRDVSERRKLERMKNEFVTTVSHELRTPLTSIYGSLGLVRDSTIGNLPGEAQHLIEIAHKNCARLVDLVNDILDVGKIEAGKLEYSMAPVSIRELIDDAMEANEAYGAQFGVTFEVSGDIPNLTVTADYRKLLQVMANLLSNASKHSPDGSRVAISVTQNASAAIVAVRDRGNGIPEEYHDVIFDKFSKIASPDSQSVRGTGLGLRVRPETLCRITEFSEHESNGRELDEGERVAVEVLPVLGQSAAAVEPGDGAFDHPTPGLDDEALHPIGSLDDLGLEIGQDAGQGAVKDRPLIGAVGEQFPEKGKQTEQGRQQRETAVAILNVGGGDDAVQQQALRIDQNMPLLALDQLAGIEAVAVDASPPFSALFTL